MKDIFWIARECRRWLEKALLTARELEVNTIQIHPSPPQRWNSKPFAPNVEAAFLAALPDSGVEKVFFHAIYLINLATPDPAKFELGKLSLLHDLELSSRIGGDGVIFHVGSLKDEPDEAVGYRRAAEGINWIMERAPKDTRLILEVAAGSGRVIGDRVEELAAIYEHVEHRENVGFGLDSQHMWASGYDFQNSLDEIVDTVDSVLGLSKVWSVHLNDSMTALGSRKDRHENIGDGLIGAEALKRFFQHPRLAHIPFILETPGIRELAGAQSEIQKLRTFLA